MYKTLLIKNSIEQNEFDEDYEMRDRKAWICRFSGRTKYLFSIGIDKDTNN